MAICSANMKNCDKKKRCLFGPNEGQAYNPKDPCCNLGEFDAATCDCISDTEYAFVRYWVWLAQKRDLQVCPGAPIGVSGGTSQTVREYAYSTITNVKNVSFNGRIEFQRLDIECCSSEDPVSTEWMFNRKYTTYSDEEVDQNTLNAIVYSGCKTSSVGSSWLSEQLYVTFGISRIDYIVEGSGEGWQTYVNEPVPVDYDSAVSNLPLFLP